MQQGSPMLHTGALMNPSWCWIFVGVLTSLWIFQWYVGVLHMYPQAFNKLIFWLACSSPLHSHICILLQCSFLLLHWLPYATLLSWLLIPKFSLVPPHLLLLWHTYFPLPSHLVSHPPHIDTHICKVKPQLFVWEKFCPYPSFSLVYFVSYASIFCKHHSLDTIIFVPYFLYLFVLWLRILSQSNCCQTEMCGCLSGRLLPHLLREKQFLSQDRQVPTKNEA